MTTENTLISVIVPIHNGAQWIDACFHSILKQTALNNPNLRLEVCICNDSSADNTLKLLKNWESDFQEQGVVFKIFNNTNGTPGGVGYSKNKAVSLSTGEFLCFQDVDDIMLPNRIQKQYEAIRNCTDITIVGSQFERNPDGSTIRFTKWANSLTQDQLNLQVFTSHGPTVIMPTWFLHKNTFDRIGGFVENEKGTPEDLIFFYKHLDFGGKIFRVDECLLIYTFHTGQTTFSIHK